MQEFSKGFIIHNRFPNKKESQSYLDQGIEVFVPSKEGQARAKPGGQTNYIMWLECQPGSLVLKKPIFKNGGETKWYKLKSDNKRFVLVGALSM